MLSIFRAKFLKSNFCKTRKFCNWEILYYSYKFDFSFSITKCFSLFVLWCYWWSCNLFYIKLFNWHQNAGVPTLTHDYTIIRPEIRGVFIFFKINVLWLKISNSSGGTSIIMLFTCSLIYYPLEINVWYACHDFTTL